MHGRSAAAALYRLSGCYAGAGDSAAIIQIGGIPVLRHDRAKDGRLLFSLDVIDAAGDRVLEISQNTLDVDAAGFWDFRINPSENHMVVRPREGEPVLELRFRYLQPDELTAMLSKDRTSGRKMFNAKMQSMGLEGISKYLDEPDMIASHVLEFAKIKCADSDGRIPLIDIVRADLWGNGRRLLIEDGVGESCFYSFACDNTGAAFAA